MKVWLATIALALCARAAHAQIPYIVGTWKLDVAASKLPGPAPQTHVRRYSLADDGTLIGLAVVVDARGRPNFLQFAAKDDGRDYAEFDSGSLARFQIDGTPGPRTYSETPIDARTVAWVDKSDGKVIASGKKWVSEDGKTLSFTSEGKNARGESVSYLYVFDRQPEPDSGR
jgi:hypothetical protein